MVRKLEGLPKFLVFNSKQNPLETVPFHFLLTAVRFYTNFYIFISELMLCG
jgi:hypothetical protein